MNRIILALVTSVAALTLAGFTTYATWTDTVTVANNQIQTGTVDLMVSADSGANWFTSGATSTMVLSSLVPGGPEVGGYSFSLKNNSTGVTTMTLKAQVNPASIINPTAGVDKTKLEFKVYRTDTDVDQTAWTTLAAWEAGTVNFTDNLNTGDTRNYGIKARLDSSALNEWQGQTATFNLVATGSQP